MPLCRARHKKCCLCEYIDVRQWSRGLTVRLREQKSNNHCSELVLCLKTLAFRFSSMRFLCVCTQLNKAWRKSTGSNAGLPEIIFLESSPGGRSESFQKKNITIKIDLNKCKPLNEKQFTTLFYLF